jgi:hypothetical protein
VHVALNIRTKGQGLGTLLLSETGSTDRKLLSLFSPSLRAQYTTTTTNTTAIPVVFHSQAASPACTELETIVLDWLGESPTVNRLHWQCESRLLP